MLAPFVQYRNEILEGLKADALLSDVAKANFGIHDGPFGDDDVERFSRALPAIMVGIGEVGGLTIYGPETVATVVGACTIVTKGTSQIDAKDQALALVSRVLRAVARDLSSSAFRSPTKERARNFYGKKTVDMGISLWMVTWEQEVKISELADESTLDDFALLFHEIEMGEDDNTADIDQLVEIETA